MRHKSIINFKVRIQKVLFFPSSSLGPKVTTIYGNTKREREYSEFNRGNEGNPSKQGIKVFGRFILAPRESSYIIVFEGLLLPCIP